MAKLLDNVHLQGLGAFRGGELNPIIGTAIGGGTAAVSTLVARHVGGLKYPELVGGALGLAATGLMATMRSTRSAALGSAIGVVLAVGASLIGKLLGEATVPAATVPPEVKGLGFPQARVLNGLGLAKISQLNGHGYPSISPVPHAQGAIPGVAGSHLAGPGGGAPPVSLMGTQSAAQTHLLGIGGPPTHGISTSYGATLLGGGR
jgi:hypothetical protein